MADDSIGRSLAIVDQALREVFPDNYWKRCTYAAFGIKALLDKQGVRCQIVSGDLLCFTLSRDGQRQLLEGYGNAPNGAPSHYWVEAAGALLDLGPHYLPNEARRAVVAMPVVRWSLAQPLPSYLRYRAMERAEAMHPASAIADRVNQFLEHCERCYRSTAEIVRHPAWELRDGTSAQVAARRGDRWARGALAFQMRVDPRQLPF